ncbi:MAG: hypothetical protein KKI08_24090, partial [Armatimonadetes bacterium]|nr:hypothetical protein [Armatimonadota bacterium]
MSTARLGLAAMLLLSLAAAPAAHALKLAAGGQALVGIVLANQPTPVEQTAATELATHLERITGAKFAVGPDPGATAGRVLIGARAIGKGLLSPEEVQALGDDGFIVRVAGNALLLAGGGPRGTLYAVYSFLEDDLGCRWLTWYGDESVPRRPELQVGALNRT